MKRCHLLVICIQIAIAIKTVAECLIKVASEREKKVFVNILIGYKLLRVVPQDTDGLSGSARLLSIV